ncbi:MAG TPA: SCP2 sterol-binding domain-containing protein [Ktedonobacteraceae bacterium]|jgi:hypothetical protein
MSKNLAIDPREGAHAAVISDLLLLARLLSTFLEDVTPDAWQQRGKRVPASEWTLHQIVAHLAAAAGFYHSVLQLALVHETPVTPGFQQRRDLPAVNQREIQKRQQMQPAELLAALNHALLNTAEIAQQLTAEQLCWPVTVPVFNRPLTIAELLDMQVVHPGIVHAAQLARPVSREPLWQEYEDAVLHRMLTRFFRLMSLIYWPERGGDLRGALQFVVAGPAGGEWYLSVSPEHCWSDEGREANPRMTLRATNADALCQAFTGQLKPVRALLLRKLSIKGDVRLALKLDSLFSPT